MKNKKRKPEKTEEPSSEFPGYPLYKPEEDIMSQGQRVDADVEDFEPLEKAQNPKATPPSNESPVLDDEVVEQPDQFSITPEDLEALGPLDLSLDMNDDEQLKHRVMPVDFAGEDLDLPGTEADDNLEAIGSEDEENNSYSLGGDNHNDLEEDRS